MATADVHGATATAQSKSQSGQVNPAPAIALLSNGRYGVLITAAGAGYSIWQDRDVTRWREDCTRDCWGQFCYVQDSTNEKPWSIGGQPLCSPDIEYEHSFYGERAEFRCRRGDIEITWALCVAPDTDVEVRLLTVSNNGNCASRVELTSYSEVCLNNRQADRAHPAFAKLFVETSFDPATGALFARRRPRDAREVPLWAVHVSSSTAQDSQSVEYETDRRKFLGRGRTAENPIMLECTEALSGTTGPVLDPVFCLRRTLELQPGTTQWVALVTGAADDEAMARMIAERYASFDAAEQAFLDAVQSYQNELLDLDLTVEEVSLFNRLAGSILFPDQALRGFPAGKREALSKSSLWSHGISGDLPIVLLRANADRHLALIREMLRAHHFAARRRLRFDLVLLDQGDGSDAERLVRELQAHAEAELLNKPGGIFVVPASAITNDDEEAIVAAARVVLSGDSGSLAEQLNRRVDPVLSPSRLWVTQPGKAALIDAATLPVESLQYWNGFGGFSADGREYVVVVNASTAQHAGLPPAPWSNVIANPSFGCLTSEAGLGYTWSGNSQLNRLTPWSNDPVSDAPGEVVYLRDEETGEVWTPTPLPLGQKAVINVHHGQGYSRYEGSSHGLRHELIVHVPATDPIKIIHLRLTNKESRPRHLSATYFAEWVLGTQREDAMMQVGCELDVQGGAIMATNAWSSDFAGAAFAASSEPPLSATSDRGEFLGRYGSVSRPDGLTRPRLAGRFGSLHDPCAALMVDVSLPAGGSKDVVFVLGQALEPEQARNLIRQYADPSRARESCADVIRQWDHVLTTVQVSTPDTSVNLMMNRWLLYQVLACRIWARTGNYQSGGAFGFRDQLQDVMALIHCAPAEARSHILRAAARQFREGDVQHWWHPPSGIGVRTRITDDLYFLPFVVHHYVSTTGDTGLLNEKVLFLSSPVLRTDQEEDFGRPEVAEESGTVYEHCIRALEYGFRLGRHGLPLMGTGDWNDGMNKVGAKGDGESVWNGWFFLTVLKGFAAISSSRGDGSRAAWCRKQAKALRTALERNAWDGAWYRRAYFDDGTPLGSSSNDECQIDAIPQAWAVISGEADDRRASKAMNAVYKRLVNEQARLIQLFDPPFDKGSLQPGYIKGYVPGIRENGGQYTHAATWVVLAAALRGEGDRAVQLWNLINPVTHTATMNDAEHYVVEPYAVCADVYGAPPHTGRGGWTWYTGSAAWLYRVGLEAILGFHRKGEFLSIEPCIPTNWSEYEIAYRQGSTTYRIHVDNRSGAGRGVRSVSLDGNLLVDGRVPLFEDGRRHEVEVILG